MHFLNLLETEVVPVLGEIQSRGMGFFGLRPLLQGMLTDRRVSRKGLDVNDPVTLPIWDSRYAVLGEVRRHVGVGDDTWAQYAVRFALSHAGVSSVITSARTVGQLEEQLAALDGGLLEEKTLHAIRSASSRADSLSKFDLFPENQVTSPAG